MMTILVKIGKEKFNETWFVKSIVAQGDVLHTSIWAQVPITTYLAPFCGITLLVCYHNMKVMMEKKELN
jgi:hypothetical protein